MDALLPDERVFREHIEAPRFLDGVARGRWRIHGEIDWPVVVFGLTAANDSGELHEVHLRFDLQDYPAAAPTITPWDSGAGRKLASERWPSGDQAAEVFVSGWKDGLALYAPFDRVTLADKPDWPQVYPRTAWNQSRDITWVLRILHGLLK